MNLTCQELLLECLDKGNIVLAHAFYIGIQQGYFMASDSANTINLDMIPKDLIIAATAKNHLKIKPVKLFVIRRTSTAEYACYLANSEEDALQKHRVLFKEHPSKIFDRTEKIYTSIIGENEPLCKAKRFFDYKKRATLPRFVGLFEARKY